MEPVLLAADDDEDAHFLLRRAFAQAGVAAALKQVSDGSEVIEYLEGRGRFASRSENPLPKLLLLDLKMPQISGFGVLEYLRSNGRPAGLLVAVFSSSDNPQDMQRAKELGCDAYLVKPCDFSGLVVLLKQIETDLLSRSPGEIRTPPFAQSVSAPEPAAVVSPSKSRPFPGKNPASDPDIFHLLVDQVKDYAIFVLDNEGFVRSWNEGARRIHGYEAREAIGQHFSVFYPRQESDSEKPAFELRIAREMGRYEEEGWRMRKDGSRFWANVIVTPLRDRQGELTGFAKVTRDLTQRKLQEEQLQHLLESEERFRLLVEQVRDYAIFFLDARGNISSWNQGARRIKGYTAEEIIGKHFSIFYPAKDLAEEKPARELSIAIQEGRYEEEGWRLKKDGSRFWASVVITALWDRRGNLTGFAKVTRDLTVRKREEEALRARTAELEAFAHTLSHDLRAPIRSISSFAQLLRDEQGRLPAAEQAAHLDRIFKSALGMENLIRDILKLSQVTLAPSAPEAVRAQEVLEEVLGVLEREIQQSGAKVSVREPLPAVLASRAHLTQIFSNLVGNALKFTRPGQAPEIEIYSIPQQEACEIHVRDHGPGVPPEACQTIFEIFNRGVAAPGVSGTGIGLAIVKKAAERSGGSVQVVSSGDGSDFVVTLPTPQPALIAA